MYFQAGTTQMSPERDYWILPVESTHLRQHAWVPGTQFSL